MYKLLEDVLAAWVSYSLVRLAAACLCSVSDCCVVT